MKKKILCLTCILCFAMLALYGCGKTTLDFVQENMAEMTNVYYYGENDDFYCSLSLGQRENPYLLNGKCEKVVDFALLSVVFEETPSSSVVEVEVDIDGQKCQKELEKNSLNQSYMVDLEQKLSGEEVVSICVNGKILNLENLSKDFVVDAKKALQIACDELQDRITKTKSFNNLNAECYLRVMDKKANNFDGVFWCFSVLNVDNENYSVIISTENGSILAKSK